MVNGIAGGCYLELHAVLNGPVGAKNRRARIASSRFKNDVCRSCLPETVYFGVFAIGGLLHSANFTSVRNGLFELSKKKIIYV